MKNQQQALVKWCREVMASTKISMHMKVILQHEREYENKINSAKCMTNKYHGLKSHAFELQGGSGFLEEVPNHKRWTLLGEISQNGEHSTVNQVSNKACMI